MGEGATFMVISGKDSNENHAYIGAIEVLYKSTKIDIKVSIDKILNENDLHYHDIDLILSGYNSSTSFTHSLNLQSFKKDVPCIFYKNYIGEYPTSTSFAIWLSEKILSTQYIPKLFNIKRNTGEYINNILIVNQYKDNTSILLISK